VGDGLLGTTAEDEVRGRGDHGHGWLLRGGRVCVSFRRRTG
jgi:hypothetical protein